MPTRGVIHHVEIWLPGREGSFEPWRWLLERLGHTRGDEWATGESWRLADTYVVLESGPDVAPAEHDRLRPGVNHLAFHAGTTSDVDDLARAAVEHGWRLMFADRHPFAGGPDHYAAYLEDADGFEVELVASQ